MIHIKFSLWSNFSENSSQAYRSEICIIPYIHFKTVFFSEKNILTADKVEKYVLVVSFHPSETSHRSCGKPDQPEEQRRQLLNCLCLSVPYTFCSFPWCSLAFRLSRYFFFHSSFFSFSFFLFYFFKFFLVPLFSVLPLFGMEYWHSGVEWNGILSFF